MRTLIAIAFLALFGGWIYLEFVSGTHESLKEAIFWAAMMLVFASSIDFKPKVAAADTPPS